MYSKFTIYQDDKSKLFGLKTNWRIGQDNSNQGILLEANYFLIKEIKNYLDLSLNNFEIFYLLKQDESSEKVYFAYPKGEELIVSKFSYKFLLFNTSEPHFYKGFSVCGDSDKKEIIIDINERIIGGPYEEGFWSCDNGEVLNLKEYKNIIQELCRSFDYLNEDETHYGYGSLLIDKNNEFTLSNYGWPIEIESKLGFNWPEHYSGFYKKIYEFSLDGLTMVMDYNDKFIFLNRYFHPIGTHFDELVSPSSLSIQTNNYFIDLDEDNIYYIKINNTINKVLLTGDFLKEMCINPTLFADTEILKNHLLENRFCNTSLAKPKDEIFVKIDESLIEEKLFFLLQENPDFNCTNEWKNNLIYTEMIKDGIFKIMFPFDISVTDNENEILHSIDEMNSLFGISYSSFKILDTYELK